MFYTKTAISGTRTLKRDIHIVLITLLKYQDTSMNNDDDIGYLLWKAH